MQVKRKIEISINKGNLLGVKAFQIGDQIQVGSYTATCQKVGKKNAIFLFDQYLDKAMVMNQKYTNEGGYKSSDLRNYLKGFVMDPMFDEIREMMVPFKNGDLLRIPMAEEIFGPEEAHKYYETLSDKKQWPLMNDCHNRIAFRGDDQTFEWGWLQNRVKESAAHFAYVNDFGVAYHNYASGAYGVRVVFGLGGVRNDEIPNKGQ